MSITFPSPGNWVRTVLGVAGPVLISALLAEGALRIYALVATTDLAEALHADPYAVLVEPHGTAGYRPRTGRAFHYSNGAVANINEMGFRGPTVMVPKPPGTFRIALFGGSTTFGWGVDDAETIGAFMRQMFGERGDGDIDVVNLAFDGYDSYQLLERLRTEGEHLELDALVINTGVNDVRNGRFKNLLDADPRTLLYRATLERMRREEARGGPTLWTRAKHHLYLARLPRWARQRFSASGAPPPSAALADSALEWDALEYFERNVRRIIELGDQQHAEVILLSTPPSSLRTRYAPDAPPERSYWIRDASTTQLYRDSLSARLQAIAVDARATGPTVVFVPHDELDSAVFLDDAHLNPVGNREVAEDFVEALEAWLPRSGTGQQR